MRLIIALLSSLLFLSNADISYGVTLNQVLNRKPQKIEPGRAGNISERDFNRLGKAQKFMADEKYNDALTLLSSLEKSMANKKYGLAQVYQTKGYVYAQTDRFAEASEAFKKTVTLKSLPLGPTLSTMYSLAQVLAAQEKYLDAIPYIQDYIFNSEQVKPDAYFFLGQVWMQVKQTAKAIENVEKAISLEKKPKEAWLRFIVALYYEKKEYPKAAAMLEKLLQIAPEKTKYWKQLSSVYVAMNAEDKALATMEVAQKHGVLTDEKDMIHLAKLSMFRDIPYKAGQYLEEAMKTDKVEKNFKNYKLLADTWVASQEMDKALDALSKAAPLAPNGEIYVRRGQIFLEKEQWKEAITDIRKGIKKGGLKKAGLAYLAMGIAQYKTGSTQSSLEAFRSAQKYPKYQKQASEWINHLKEESAITH
ncbi:MAG: tetratricopeptide repeat protein [Pseudobacteriovorax sp.]|nr:tetratricopeptide repeat protein [Pseudobacteriovorax sp.]